MDFEMLKCKIHRATVTEANVEYVGSITIDSSLMAAAGNLEFEKVCVADVDNGARLETYAMKGEAGSGIVCLNGAAAHCCEVGDKVIIMAYARMSAEEAASHRPTIVLVDDNNNPLE